MQPWHFSCSQSCVKVATAQQLHTAEKAWQTDAGVRPAYPCRLQPVGEEAASLPTAIPTSLLRQCKSLALHLDLNQLRGAKCSCPDQCFQLTRGLI